MRALMVLVLLIHFLGSKAQRLSITQFIAKDVEVITVTPKGGYLEIGGYYPNGVYGTDEVAMGRSDVFSISTTSFRPYLSLLTIPFKVRAAVDTLSPTVQTGLANAGIAINLLDRRTTRYFNTGKQSTHRFGIGFFFAPSAEDVSPANTRGKVTTTSKQLFLSAGISATYTYNDLTFAFLPVGFDIATTSEGKRFIHAGQHWWGFGIGITTKLIGRP